MTYTAVVFRRWCSALISVRIATRSFERRFALADQVNVTGADLADGMLALTLKREIPEAMKPRKIEIRGEGGTLLEGEKVKETERLKAVA